MGRGINEGGAGGVTGSVTGDVAATEVRRQDRKSAVRKYIRVGVSHK